MKYFANISVTVQEYFTAYCGCREVVETEFRAALSTDRSKSALTGTVQQRL
jgi:hypothetical protein